MQYTEERKTEIYEEFSEKVFGYIIKKINNKTVAEDLHSEVFLKVFEKLDSYNEELASLSTWIYTIARNTVTDYFRTNRTFEEIPETKESQMNVEDDIINGEELQSLAKALKQLSEYERDVIVFHYYDGLSLKDISEKMSLSYSYIKVLHTNALKSLKKKINI